jgi:hypothetical protein
MKRNNIKDKDAHAKGEREQLDLFWAGDPSMVIAIIQFMQFGYALALAILVIFWNDINGTVNPLFFLLAVFACYAIFLSVVGKVIPQYTLCTSLGHLVNQKNLQETLALYRLREAQRRQKRRLAALAYDNESAVLMGPEEEADLSMTQPFPSSGRSRKVVAGDADDEKKSLDQTKLLSELIKMDTKSLRSNLPEASRENLLSREQRLRERRNRRKSVSEGVGAMRSGIGLGASPAAATMLNKPAPWALAPRGEPVRAKDDFETIKMDRAERASRRKKTLSASNVIQQWQSASTPKDTFLANAKKTSPLLPAPPVASPPVGDYTGIRQDRAERARRRHARQKSVSASAVISSWSDFSVSDDQLAAAPSSLTSNSPEILHPLVEGQISEIPPNSLPTAEDDSAPLVDLSGSPVMPVIPVVDSVPLSSGNSVHSLHDKIDDEHRDDDDESTVDTAGSMGGLSDVVDVPGSDVGIGSVYHEITTWSQNFFKNITPSAIGDRLRTYFLNGRYRTISHVFGTLICFFFVGHRVEAMLAITGVIDESVDTWNLRLDWSFWAQITWLSLFILGAVQILTLFPRSRRTNLKSRSIVISAAFDILISGCCLIFLVVAEYQRCCSDEEQEELLRADDDYNRFLAEASAATDYPASDYGNAYETDTNCCTGWGDRTYGGVGNLEPFTSLICLRVFRFVLSNVFVRYLDQRKAFQNESGNLAPTPSERNPFRAILFGESARPHTEAALVHGEKGSGHGLGPMHGEKGTALELWECAITKYPDIAAKYGEFSGELFQAMLGLQIIEATPPAATSVVIQAPDNTSSTNVETTHLHQPTPELGKAVPHRSLLSAKQYIDLPPEAQGIILAGKLGKPVKSMRNLLSHSDTVKNVPNLPTLTEDATQAESTRKLHCKFEIDDAQLAIEEKEVDGLSMLIAPNARVLRSMRRCHRRLLPLLTKWTAVDVVMTQFELVYFEAYDPGALEDVSEEAMARNTTLLAIQATHGGKGLRLCDVTVGRKIVGHLGLGDITEVHVERDMPVEDIALLNAGEVANDEIELQFEYWSKPKDRKSDTIIPSRNIRFAKIKEDRLKLTSMHGTLYLRFYSDLEDAEAHLERLLAENEMQGPLAKDIAFQWAQTIARLNGREQLKQNLPHFGDGTSEELRDYLEVVSEKDRKSHSRKKSSLAFGQNFFSHLNAAETESRHAMARHASSLVVSEPSSDKKGQRKIFQSSKSFGVEELFSTDMKLDKPSLRRSVSGGDSSSNRIDFAGTVQRGDDPIEKAPGGSFHVEDAEDVVDA